MIDLYASRRDRFIECKYWLKIKDKNIVKPNQIIFNTIPTGSFYAKEVNPYSKNNQVIAELFMLKEESVLISTCDDVSGLELNDRVEMDEKKYRVNSIQESPFKKNRQFSTSITKEYFIELRR